MRNRLLLILSITGILAFAGSEIVRHNLVPDSQKIKTNMQNSHDNDGIWKKIDSLANEGLPQSALSLVNSIYQAAEKDGNMPEFLKASIYQLKLRSDFEENYIEHFIGETEKNIDTKAAPARQVLHSILADLYWQYYQQNRYKILDQSINPSNTSTDLETWDAVRFVQKTSAHYQASLENSPLLKSIPLKIFDPILQPAEGSKKFRPTLFDFIAHRAVDFFKDNEASITRPLNPFIMKDSALLGTTNDFISSKIQTSDTLSFHYQAIRLLKQMEAFHQNDKDPVAYIDVLLKRMEFVRSMINLQNRDSVYLKTLTQLEADYADLPVSADIIEKIAAFWYTENIPSNLKSSVLEQNEPGKNYVIARQWCLKAIEKYPESDGAKNCRMILNDIEEPSVSFIVDQQQIADQAFPVLLNFRNTKTIWFRLLKPDYDSNTGFRQEVYSERGMEKYLEMKPVKSWSLTLPPTSDYLTHSVEIIMPAIELGYYALLVSGSEDFKQGSNTLAVQDFWVSNISYLSKRNDDGSGLFYVLDRASGKPLQDVTVQSFTREYDSRSRSYIRKHKEVYKTLSDGSFIIKTADAKDNATLSFDFKLKNDRLVAENYFSRYRNYESMKGEKLNTFFFTDRAIYRPGQIVYFKGIVVGKEGEVNRIVAGEQSTVNLFDVNGQKLSSIDVSSNEFGSFSGSFVLPASLLGGQFRIENGTGSTFINVEEYKRPKFEVQFQPIAGNYRLNETVTLTGKAESYTGVPVTGANVSYRIIRAASFPFMRYGYRLWPGHLPESEIANGQLTTLSDGTFELKFNALPDPSDFGDLDPVYHYTVFVDVTDLNGETHSAVTSVPVSSKNLLIALDMPLTINRDNDPTFRLSSTNLNGKSIPAEIKIEAYKLKQHDRITRKRNWEAPDMTLYEREEFIKQLPSDLYMNENEQALNKDKSVYQSTVNTTTDSVLTISGLSKWEPGKYLITLSATDAYGQKVNSDKEIVVFSAESKKIPVKQALWCSLLTPEVKAGNNIRLLAGSAVKNAQLLYEVQLKGKTVKQEWINLSQEQKQLDFNLPSDFSGTVDISLTMVYDNRSESFITSVNVPDKRHELNIAFESFRSPLLPGGTEKWKLKITNPDGQPLSAELLTTMYDASLDAFAPLNWPFSIYEKWYEATFWEKSHAFETAFSFVSRDRLFDRNQLVSRQYDQLNWFGYNMFGRGFNGRGLKGGFLQPEAMAKVDNVMPEDDKEYESEELSVTVQTDSRQSIQNPEPQIRRNLNETAFFYPQLSTNEQGEIQIEFTTPEALTRWNFMGLAHTTDLRYHQFTKEVITRKDLMVTPNLPRYFREGDKISIQTKVSNLSPNPMQGWAKLQLFDAISMKPLDDLMKNDSVLQDFSVDKLGNTSVQWEIAIPDGLEAVMVRITAQAGNYSDGEEMILPVLTNRMLVTETFPLPVNGKETKKFDFLKLIHQSDNSSSLRNHRLTLEFTSNPAWYAVQALPYLTEQSGENTDQIFNRLYANSLAAFIANSNPKIKAVFDSWKNLTPDALLSNLEKNQELKNLMIEETPWLMDAKDESAQKQRIALMFDINRMASEKQTATQKLQQSQSVSGGWSWFAGMPESRYITQLIVSGFGKLHYLKVTDLSKDDALHKMVQQAVVFLSREMADDYNRLLKDYPKDMEKNHLSEQQIQFLYAMSYLPETIKPDKNAEKAIAYFSEQARKYWTGRGLFTQGMIGLWAGRSGDRKTSSAILKSVREKALSNTETGMYWRDNTGGFYWHQAPVETQSLLIEFFEEFGNDSKSVDQMKTWLLKQKQTQSWPTSRATADAVYALLLRGGDWLQTNPGVNITVGEQTLNLVSKQPDTHSEAGTGYFKKSWNGGEITPQMGNVSISKSTTGPAWGALYWQYFEQLDKISGHNSPLRIHKQLFIKTNTENGPVLQPINDSNTLQVGQQITVRVELSTDRDLEYVHLKDMRAAGFEPVNTLSGYRWNGGLGYYENTRDAASNYFFSYLPKGTWIFEYPLTVTHSGTFSNGITTVECMYAPEYSAHSEGSQVIIR
ncbi:MAG: MG2 domain-containing protein [Lentimicrobium sp.]|nr:MG2 domain-containing protein [Lentimicrobium sp.]